MDKTLNDLAADVIVAPADTMPADEAAAVWGGEEAWLAQAYEAVGAMDEWQSPPVSVLSGERMLPQNQAWPPTAPIDAQWVEAAEVDVAEPPAGVASLFGGWAAVGLLGALVGLSSSSHAAAQPQASTNAPTDKPHAVANGSHAAAQSDRPSEKPPEPELPASQPKPVANHDKLPQSADDASATVDGVRIYHSKNYGDYVKATDFGAVADGKTDSLAAIQTALKAAAKAHAMVYLEGRFYISDQIVINGGHNGLRGLFGAGMGKTVIRFDKPQQGVFDSNTNQDDIREYAGILVDGQNRQTLADFSIEYGGGDFYRHGQSYFGKVCGILVNDADHTLIRGVEASGANRAGVMFTSTAALTREAGAIRSFKARVATGEIDEHDHRLPLGEHNRITDSYLHHNRVAGALLAYQKDFVAEGNRLARNGHEADGGTGYGIAASAGSYNYGVTFRGNTTDHNYRKGLDIHDGTDILIENNSLNGDRLYGIAVYNRQFSMDNVVIRNNKVIHDPTFHLANDDDLGAYYRLYSGIQLQTNTQRRDLHSADQGYFEISGNSIEKLALFGNNIQQYGIEFRNHEPKMDYVLDISGNRLSGESTKYLIAVINDTSSSAGKGIGSGTISISGNRADIDIIGHGATPVFVEEKNAADLPTHGSVTLDGNHIRVAKTSGGYAEFAYLSGNAADYTVTRNHLDLHGRLNDGLVDIKSTAKRGSDVDVYVADNRISSDIQGDLYPTWLRYNEGVDVAAEGNRHNGKALAPVHEGQAGAWQDALADAVKSVGAARQAAYALMPESGVSVEHNHIGAEIM